MQPYAYDAVENHVCIDTDIKMSLDEQCTIVDSIQRQDGRFGLKTFVNFDKELRVEMSCHGILSTFVYSLSSDVSLSAVCTYILIVHFSLIHDFVLTVCLESLCCLFPVMYDPRESLDP